MVPIKEMTDVMRVVKETAHLKAGQWVRLKRGVCTQQHNVLSQSVKFQLKIFKNIKMDDIHMTKSMFLKWTFLSK